VLEPLARIFGLFREKRGLPPYSTYQKPMGKTFTVAASRYPPLNTRGWRKIRFVRLCGNRRSERGSADYEGDALETSGRVSQSLIYGSGLHIYIVPIGVAAVSLGGGRIVVMNIISVP